MSSHDENVARKMAHISEVGSWPTGETVNAEIAADATSFVDAPTSNLAASIAESIAAHSTLDSNSPHQPRLPRRALRPDAQPFDEIRITTQPRYKTSGLSGDEWRISSRTQFLRKGTVRHQTYHGTIESACRLLDSDLLRAMDDGLACYGGEGNICDQEGCSEESTVTYRMHKSPCPRCGQSSQFDDHDTTGEIVVRKFCPRHSRRGDCGIDDADANYELLRGQVELPLESDMSESQRVVIDPAMADPTSTSTLRKVDS